MPRGCSVIRCGAAARIDVPKNFLSGFGRTSHFSGLRALYTGRTDAKSAGRRAGACLHQAVCLMGLGDSVRTQPADRQLQTHTGGNPRLTRAKRQQTAIAAYWRNLVGAAVMGARGRQPPFDPLQDLAAVRSRGWATRTRELRQRRPTLFNVKRCKSAPGGVRNTNGATWTWQVG